MPPQRFPKTSKFWDVCKLEEDLMNLTAWDTTLSTTKLKNMGIERAPPLDIDNPDAVDANPVFFQPIPDSPEFKEAFAASRRDIYNWHRCTDERSDFGTLHCVSHLIGWLSGVAYGVAHVHNLYPADRPQWLRISPGGGNNLPKYSATSVYLEKHHEPPPQPLPEWYSEAAFYFPNKMVKTEGMRHAGLLIGDTTSHRSKPDDALRSEITAGVSFIRRRMWTSQDTHNTIPVLVISFYHNETARITQMCWNGEHSLITIRQSRLLDVSTESLDTPDAAILIRWMRCIPLREPRVIRRRGVAGVGGTTLQSRRPTTPDQVGTPQPGTNARPTTPTPTRTQNGPGIASGRNKTPPRSGTSTPPQRPPGAITNTPRSGTPTPLQRPPSASSNHPTPRSGTPTNAQQLPHTTPSGTTTPRGTTTTTTGTGTGNNHPRPPAQGSTPPRQGTPTGNGSGGGAHTAVPRQTPPQTPGRDGAAAAGPSPPRNNNAPSGLSQSANLPTRNGNGNGNGNHGDGNGHRNGNGNADGSHTQQPGGPGSRH